MVGGGVAAVAARHSFFSAYGRASNRSKALRMIGAASYSAHQQFVLVSESMWARSAWRSLSEARSIE